MGDPSKPSIKLNIPGLNENGEPLEGDKTEKFEAVETTKENSGSKGQSLWERAKGALKNSVGSKDWWFKERTLDVKDDESRAMQLTKKILRPAAAIGNPLYNMAATLGGTKVLESATLHWLQSKEIKGYKKEITALLSGEGKLAEKQAQIQSILENASMAKKLSPKEFEDFQAALHKASEGDEYERDAKYEAVLDNYLRAKTTGHEVVKQGLNTAFMLTGMNLVRAGATLTMKGVELYAASKLEKDRGSEQGLGEILRSKFVESAKKKVSWMYDKDQTKMQRFANAAEALGVIGTFVGLGNAALGEINAGQVTSHMSEAVHKLGSTDAGAFMVQNFENNMQRNLHLYGDGFQNAYKGMKGLLGDVKESFFGGGAAQAHAMREAAVAAHGGTPDGVRAVSDMTRGSATGMKDGVNYAAEASVGKPSAIDFDGYQQAEQMSAVTSARIEVDGEHMPESMTAAATMTGAERYGAMAGKAILGVHEKVGDAIGRAGASAGQFVENAQISHAMNTADRTLEFGEEAIVAERPLVGDRTLEFEEDSIVAERPRAPHVTHRPEYTHVREALRGGEAKVAPVDEQRMTPAESTKFDKDIVQATRKVDAAIDEMMAKRTAGVAEVSTIDPSAEVPKSALRLKLEAQALKDRTLLPDEPDAPKSVVRAPVAESAAAAQVKAELAKATKGLDNALTELSKGTKPSKLAESLAAAEEQKGQVAGGAKSALRLKLEAQALKDRTLLPDEPEAPKQMAKAPVAEDPAKAAMRARVKAEMDKAFRPIDEAIAQKPKPSKLAESLAAAEEHKGQVAGGAKSALRLKLEAQALKDRTLLPDEPDASKQFVKSTVKAVEKGATAAARKAEIAAKVKNELDKVMAPIDEAMMSPQDRVRAEVAKATAELDKALADMPKGGKSKLAESLAAAEEQKGQVAGGAKSALRLKLEAQALKDRTLLPDEPEAPKQMAKAPVAEDPAKAAMRARVKAEMDKAFRPIDEAMRSPQDRVRAEVAKATADLDKALADMPKGGTSKLAESLAAAEEQSRAKAELAQNGGKSARRIQLEDIDRKGRQLQPDSEQIARNREFVRDMKKTLEGGVKSVDASLAREQMESMNKDLSRFGMKLEHTGKGDVVTFDAAKLPVELRAHRILDGNHPFVAKNADPAVFNKVVAAHYNTLSGRDRGLDLVGRAYQIGVLEHEARSLPPGAARDAVLAMKEKLTNALDKSIAKIGGNVIDPSKVKKMIAAVAKNPDKF